MKHINKIAYIFLAVVFFLSGLAVIRLRTDPVSQFIIVLILSVFYLMWGMVYHHLKGEISRKLFLEYLLVAAIAAVAGFLVFVR